MRSAPVAAWLLLVVALPGCGMIERVSRINRPPALSSIDNPVQDPQWRPVTMPTPDPYPPPLAANSLWRPGSRTFLRDQRAAQVGDLVTILVSIQDTAELQNRTQRARSGTDTSGLAQFFGLQGRWFPPPADPATLISSNGQQNSDGNGTLKRSDTITLRLAATVTQVLPNGNMVVSGKQAVRVNAELRELAVQGVLRPQDIASDNTIRHERLAEARLAYGGRGTLSDLQMPRYGQQIWDIILPF